MNDLSLACAASATASALLGLQGLARRHTASWPTATSTSSPPANEPASWFSWTTRAKSKKSSMSSRRTPRTSAGASGNEKGRRWRQDPHAAMPPLCACPHGGKAISPKVHRAAQPRGGLTESSCAPTAPFRHLPLVNHKPERNASHGPPNRRSLPAYGAFGSGADARHAIRRAKKETRSAL